jgi:hypothetical protein
MDYEPTSVRYNPAISMIKRFRKKGFYLCSTKPPGGGILLGKMYPDNHVHLLIIDRDTVHFVFGLKCKPHYEED